MASINVTPAELDGSADKINGQVEQYNKTFRALIQEVQNLSSKWKGEGNEAYRQQIEGFEPEFMKLEKVLRNYESFLRQASKIYGKTEDHIRSGARRLASGR